MSTENKLGLSKELLAEVTDCATAQGNVEDIIVFGSYARGEETPQSDVDLYITLKDSVDRARSAARIGAAVSACFARWGLFNDVVIRPAALYREKSRDRFSLEYQVAREGVPIYG